MSDAPLTALLATLPRPTVAIDADERILALNGGAQMLLGQGALGRHYITVLRQPALVAAVEHCAQDDLPRVVPFLSGDPALENTYDVHLQRVSAGGPVILSFRDVTERAEAGQMRRDFVANVSHELRTPLTSLMGFIDTLRGPAKDDAAARDRFLGIMATEAERMNRLVGDLLSLSRVEVDERVRPTTQVDLGGLIYATIRNIKPIADEANVGIVSDLGSGPLQLMGDPDQLQQVFSNLIENAIKYGGRDKRINVTAQMLHHDRAMRGPAIQITVTDQGPGIDAHHLPRLTERFYRADSHRSRALGGTGLGLAIVKHILNRHRGRLKVTSDPGNGAQFTVTLPCDTDHVTA